MENNQLTNEILIELKDNESDNEKADSAFAIVINRKRRNFTSYFKMKSIAILKAKTNISKVARSVKNY